MRKQNILGFPLVKWYLLYMARRIYLTEGQFKGFVEHVTRIANEERYRVFREAVDWLKEYVLRRMEAPSQETQNFYYKRGFDYKYSFETLVKTVKGAYSEQSEEFARKVAARAVKELDDENKLNDFRK